MGIPLQACVNHTSFRMKNLIFVFFILAVVTRNCSAVPINSIAEEDNGTRAHRVKRSATETSQSQADLSGGMCFIMYTSGAEEKLSCIQRTACEDPKTAEEYGVSARMVYKVHKMVGLNFSPKYETILNALEDAKSHSLAGGDCSVYAW